ncbi:MAG: hypothetical protein RO469_10210 [Thermincola sp.]|nr:hypothetical protein [Thermincola sp.]MDT3702562.1 hypothetical protein [Thermincola sp.]
MRNVDAKYDIGTWGFMGLGWWISHLAAVAAVGFVGYYARKLVRR